MRVTVKRSAKHVPRHHQGAEVEVLEERTFGGGSFAREWLWVRFDDGHEQWVLADRVEG